MYSHRVGSVRSWLVSGKSASVASEANNTPEIETVDVYLSRKSKHDNNLNLEDEILKDIGGYNQVLIGRASRQSCQDSTGTVSPKSKTLNAYHSHGDESVVSKVTSRSASAEHRTLDTIANAQKSRNIPVSSSQSRKTKDPVLQEVIPDSPENYTCKYSLTVTKMVKFL